MDQTPKLVNKTEVILEWRRQKSVANITAFQKRKVIIKVCEKTFYDLLTK